MTDIFVRKKEEFYDSSNNEKDRVQGHGQQGISKDESGRKYKSDVRAAYDIGYARGWDDAYDVPKRFGAKTAAAYGYRKGIKYRRKTDKYTKQYARKGKKN